MIEYVYRKKKRKYRYHIKTATGTACRMENSDCFRKLDTVSIRPPEGRKLCETCDFLVNNTPFKADVVEREAWEREATWD